MGEFVRKNRALVALTLVAAVCLRLLFIWRWPHVDGDSFVYGALAKNLLLYHVYGFGTPPTPTIIRLPGYPAFLAAVWSVAGIEHYKAAMYAQLVFDFCSILLIAAIARRLISERAAKAALIIAAICPFTANYVAVALTETVEIFFTTLAFYCAVRGLEQIEAGDGYGWWAGCGGALIGAIGLRPDGGVVLGAIGLYLLWWLWRKPWKKRVFTAAVVMSVVALAPLGPWALRNWRDFHVVQPLVPFYANEPGEYVPLGFERWVRSWLVEYASVEDVYWIAPGEEMDINDLPSRAFDSPQQYQETSDVIDEFNADGQDIDPELDQKFATLADQRVRHSWFRYYVWLPMLRVTDMWLRPRNEMLPHDIHWWRFREDPMGSEISIALGLLNLALIVAAIWGCLRGKTRYATMFILFLVARSLLLASVTPEPRYTLECFPAIFLFAAAALSGRAAEARARVTSA